MKTIFKPLGVAAAVAAVTAGYAGVSSAAEVSARNVGDLALVPYYTVRSGFATGVHIINTTNLTQTVKVRARRGSDSMDSLDFNLIMSPKDEWVGSLTQREDGVIVFRTDDNTCTAPKASATGNPGVTEFIMPDDTSVDTEIDFRTGAEEGYIEVIGMGQIDGGAAGFYAKHVDGEPRDCAKVRENFFRVDGAQTPGYLPGSNPVKGVHSPGVTAQECSGTTLGCGALVSGLAVNVWEDTASDALKVSWGITDGNAGLEVGGNAVHIEDFAQLPMMSNQQRVIFGEQDALGYFFPDLDGGSPFSLNASVPTGAGDTEARGLFDAVDGVRAALGASSVQNDWSARDSGSFTVGTDWVITMPGQYLMLDPLEYLFSLESESLNKVCLADNDCNARDLPAKVDITYYDREELGFTPEDEGLVVSPSFGELPGEDALPYEVNVITWNLEGGGVDPVFDSEYVLNFKPQFGEDRGWADLKLTASAARTQGVWFYGMDPNSDGSMVDVVNTAVPVIGFTAWERNFTASPDRNYGRAIDHSYGS